MRVEMIMDQRDPGGLRYRVETSVTAYLLVRSIKQDRSPSCPASAALSTPTWTGLTTTPPHAAERTSKRTNAGVSLQTSATRRRSMGLRTTVSAQRQWRNRLIARLWFGQYGAAELAACATRRTRSIDNPTRGLKTEIPADKIPLLAVAALSVSAIQPSVGNNVPRLQRHTVISRRRNSWICSLLSFSSEVRTAWVSSPSSGATFETVHGLADIFHGMPA